MNIEDLRDCCLAIKNAEESTPFGEDILVYKVMNKMFSFFLLNPKEAEYFVVLKCDPEKNSDIKGKVPRYYQRILYRPHFDVEFRIYSERCAGCTDC